MQIPSGVFNRYYEVCDHLLSSDFFSSECKIYYPAKTINCTNCRTRPIPGISTNIYNNGPMNFSNGDCPYCEGKGYLSVEQTDNIRLRIYYEKTKFDKDVINHDAFKAQIIGHMADLPKINRADYLLLETDLEGNYRVKVRLSSPPLSWGFGDKYFSCYVEKNA